jgi:AcrR family transcriptional regulator
MSDAPLAEERRGRRPGEGNAREDIEIAARESFARDGFATTSIRGVARAAGVDPALVRHYFGSKEKLFAAVIRLPFDPGTGIRRMSEAGRSRVGRELATVVAEILADPERSQRVVALVRAAATEPQGARLIQGALNDAVLVPLVGLLNVDRADERAALASSQIIGFLMAVLVLELPPLAGLDSDGVIGALGPALQHTLTG